MFHTKAPSSLKSTVNGKPGITMLNLEELDQEMTSVVVCKIIFENTIHGINILKV